MGIINFLYIFKINITLILLVTFVGYGQSYYAVSYPIFTHQ
jgi:hypothetical protein